MANFLPAEFEALNIEGKRKAAEAEILGDDIMDKIVRLNAVLKDAKKFPPEEEQYIRKNFKDFQSIFSKSTNLIESSEHWQGSAIRRFMHQERNFTMNNLRSGMWPLVEDTIRERYEEQLTMLKDGDDTELIIPEKTVIPTLVRRYIERFVQKDEQ